MTVPCLVLFDSHGTPKDQNNKRTNQSWCHILLNWMYMSWAFTNSWLTSWIFSLLWLSFFSFC